MGADSIARDLRETLDRFDTAENTEQRKALAAKLVQLARQLHGEFGPHTMERG